MVLNDRKLNNTKLYNSFPLE